MGRYAGVPTVEQLQVVCVAHAIGQGVESDPVRIVRDYYEQDGTHIFRVDPYLEDETP